MRVIRWLGAWRRGLRLQTRLTLQIVVLVTVLFGILLPLILLVQDSVLRRMAQTKGLGLVRVFAFSSVQGLITQDFLTLRELIRSLVRQPGVRYAMILDLDGRVLTHSRVSASGRTLRDPLSQAALRATEVVAREARGPRGERLYDFAAPVLLLGERRAVARIGVSFEQELHVLRQTRNLIVGLGLLTLAVGLLWARFHARRMAQPIRTLAEGAEALARGELDRRIVADRRDELGELARSFNGMAESLEQRYREIQELNLGLEAKVRQRTQALQDANAKLQALDRLKSEFVSNVSHELRTPLAAIRVSVENLLDGVAGDVAPPVHTYLDRIQANSDRLVRLITDLLDLSRIEEGRLELRQEPLRLPALLTEALETLAPVAREKGLELHLARGVPETAVLADRDKLAQVLVNLVGNAIKFTPAGGRITVSAAIRDPRPAASRPLAGEGAAAAGAHARGGPVPAPPSDAPSAASDEPPAMEIAVEDTGEGIPPEEREAIFEKFHQVRRAGRGRAPGTGLGLAITKSLVELQGGRIRVESQVGRGSVFRVLLPLAPP